MGKESDNKKKIIYTFDTADFLLYPIMKECFELTDNEIYQTIECEFDVLQKQLLMKKIIYSELKGALIPNQDVDKTEICMVIDTLQIENSYSASMIFEQLIPLLDKKSTYSILCGDYIDFLRESKDSQYRLYSALFEDLKFYNATKYRYSSQYFLIYFNRLSNMQLQKIVDELSRFEWFTGIVDLRVNTRFKTYISAILTPVCIKNRDKIIASHPADYSDNENINMKGFPFEKYGYKFLSINENSFDAFLSYKIQSILPNKTDVSFSLNALFPKFESMEQVDLEILDEKWYKYLTNQDTGKGQLLEVLGYGSESKEEFKREILKQVCANYIYNLQRNEYGDLMFNVCAEMPTIRGSLRRTTIALKYLPQQGKMSVITVT